MIPIRTTEQEMSLAANWPRWASRDFTFFEVESRLMRSLRNAASVEQQQLRAGEECGVGGEGGEAELPRRKTERRSSSSPPPSSKTERYDLTITGVLSYRP